VDDIGCLREKTKIKSLKHPETKINKQNFLLPSLLFLGSPKTGLKSPFQAVPVPTNLAVTRIAKPPWNRLRAVAHVA